MTQNICIAHSHRRIGDVFVSRALLDDARDNLYLLLFGGRILEVEYTYEDLVRYRMAHPNFRALRPGEVIPTYDADITMTTGTNDTHQYTLRFKERPKVLVRPLHQDAPA